MREIKFRVWNKHLKKFVTGYESSRGNYDELYSDPPGLFLDSLEKIIYDKNYALQQSIGLEDKNGVDIYEGDILKVKSFGGWFDKEGFYYNSTVFYSNKSAQFLHSTKPELGVGQKFDTPTYSDPNLNSTIEVIGNIFEGIKE